MGPKHTREQILAGALAVAHESGLSQLSYGRVAKHLGISDRTVVYYFASKDELVSEVLLALGVGLQESLAVAFSEPAAGHLELARRAWPVLATPEVDPAFALFFEASGLAAAGREPFVSLVPQLVEAWVAWTEEFVEGPGDARRSEAVAAVALIDGLLLIRQLCGPAAAELGAQALGIS